MPAVAVSNCRSRDLEIWLIGQAVVRDARALARERVQHTEDPIVIPPACVQRRLATLHSILCPSWRLAMKHREADREAEVPRGAISKVCFAVAACAFAAAALGMLINMVFAGWIAVSGMVALGLFYTALGLLNFTPGSLWRAKASTIVTADENTAAAEASMPVAAVRKAFARGGVASAESIPSSMASVNDEV